MNEPQITPLSTPTWMIDNVMLWSTRPMRSMTEYTVVNPLRSAP